MEKLICNQKFIDPLYFNNFFIDDDGNIVRGSREQKTIFDRNKSDHFYITSKLSIDYFFRDNIEMVRFNFLNRHYEDTLSNLFVRSYLGYNFNSLKDHEGKTGLNSLKVNGISLIKPYAFRKSKLATKQEQRFYDLWVSGINEDFISILHGKYFQKWCGDIVNKQFRDKFLYFYRAAIKRLKNSRSGICSEVFVAYRNHFYFIDFFIPSLNLGIEIDGFHHYYNIETATNDFIRTSEIKEQREVEIIRFPNTNVENFTIVDMKALIEICFDRCGYTTIKSISTLKDIKTLELKRIARSILNRKSASNFPDLHSKYIEDAICKQVKRLHG